MEKSKYVKIAKLHFILLIFILSNYTVYKIIGFGIDIHVVIAAKLILYVSGIFLFFTSLKPLKAIAFYFSFYVISPTVIIIFYFAHGIFLGMLASIFLAPVLPLTPDYADNDIRVYSRFNGFLGRCCDYYVTENKFFLFENHIGDVPWGHIDFEQDKIFLEGDSIRIEADSVYRLKLE